MTVYIEQTNFPSFVCSGIDEITFHTLEILPRKHNVRKVEHLKLLNILYSMCTCRTQEIREVFKLEIIFDLHV